MQTGFSTQMIELAFNGDLSCAKTLSPVDYVTRDGRRFRIPKFQNTDFASTPKAVWGFPLFLIPTGWWSIPAIGHDAAFQNTLLAVHLDGSVTLANLTEAQCNDLLCEMMCAIKPNQTLFETSQMRAIYEGVTLGGWHAFKEDRQGAGSDASEIQPGGSR